MSIDRLLNWDRNTALAAAPRFTHLHPNCITSISLFLAVAGLAAIHLGTTWVSAASGGCLIFASRWMDWIDGYVARASGRSTNLGGLYDIAVGYFTMVTVMIVIGLRKDDMSLAWLGAGTAVILRVVLMRVGWGLARRQRLDVVPWNPQKILTARQRPWMRKIKYGLDACRADYGIAALSLAGGAGLHLWAWFYTAVVVVLTIWVLIATCHFLQRVPPGAPRHTPCEVRREAERC